MTSTSAWISLTANQANQNTARELSSCSERSSSYRRFCSSESARTAALEAEVAELSAGADTQTTPASNSPFNTIPSCSTDTYKASSSCSQTITCLFFACSTKGHLTSAAPTWRHRPASQNHKHRPFYILKVPGFSKPVNHFTRQWMETSIIKCEQEKQTFTTGIGIPKNSNLQKFVQSYTVTAFLLFFPVVHI